MLINNLDSLYFFYLTATELQREHETEHVGYDSDIPVGYEGPHHLDTGGSWTYKDRLYQYYIVLVRDLLRKSKNKKYNHKSLDIKWIIITMLNSIFNCHCQKIWGIQKGKWKRFCPLSFLVSYSSNQNEHMLYYFVTLLTFSLIPDFIKISNEGGLILSWNMKKKKKNLF